MGLFDTAALEEALAEVRKSLDALPERIGQEVVRALREGGNGHGEGRKARGQGRGTGGREARRNAGKSGKARCSA